MRCAMRSIPRWREGSDAMAYSPHPPAGDTTDAVLAIRNLSVEVAVAGNPVVRHLSLDVHAGETVCVVGDSRSGNSVSSLAVIGLLPPRALLPSAALRLPCPHVIRPSPPPLPSLPSTPL